MDKAVEVKRERDSLVIEKLAAPAMACGVEYSM